METNKVILDPPRLRPFESKGNILNGIDALEWLRSQNGLIGWTYTINPTIWRSCNFLAIICQHGSYLNDHIRIADECHAKCYITPKNGMLIGSYNLVKPQFEDVCYLVDDALSIKHMKKQFELAWKALS